MTDLNELTEADLRLIHFALGTTLPWSPDKKRTLAIQDKIAKVIEQDQEALHVSR